MTIYLARTYLLKPDKLEEHNKWGKKLVALMKTQPDLFKGVKSMQVFRHKQDESGCKFTALWGFEKISDIKEWKRGFKEIPEEKALRAEIVELFVEGSFSSCILKSIKTMKRKTKPKCTASSK